MKQKPPKTIFTDIIDDSLAIVEPVGFAGGGVINGNLTLCIKWNRHTLLTMIVIYSMVKM